jgi:hypothetical protein
MLRRNVFTILQQKQQVSLTLRCNLPPEQGQFGGRLKIGPFVAT